MTLSFRCRTPTDFGAGQHANLRSFIRQLNMYDFRKCTTERSALGDAIIVDRDVLLFKVRPSARALCAGVARRHSLSLMFFFRGAQNPLFQRGKPELLTTVSRRPRARSKKPSVESPVRTTRAS